MNDSTLISMRIDKNTLDAIDGLVSDTYFLNRSEVIRRLLRFVLLKSSRADLLYVLQHEDSRDVSFKMRSDADYSY